jgi:predicted O-linked N-acetylglucosamine transferase (SPINDLY family)
LGRREIDDGIAGCCSGADFGNASAELEAALVLKPDSSLALFKLASLQMQLEQPAQAIETCRRVIKLEPHSSEAQAWLMRTCCTVCDWNEHADWQDWLQDADVKTGNSAEPWSLMALEDKPERHLIRAKHYFNAMYYRQEDAIPPRNKQHGKIRIGYFSADVCHHATMILLWPLIVRRNQQRFEFILYSFYRQSGFTRYH